MSLFENNPHSTVKQMLDHDAVIIDVRTPAEFMGGHVVDSVNIPLNTLRDRLDEIKAISSPIVLCCASGGRSGQATSFLKQEGVLCENGGGWMQVNALVNS
ncbi:rhodanese-like domain-containing protein [Owenweeksia hongkongensis]|uniref:rhodanese-like domain-containing protein n=1 Tax=Owenweeksia hongkongensis TaxID=253245 RepID=UPI003A93DCD2